MINHIDIANCHFAKRQAKRDHKRNNATIHDRLLPWRRNMDTFKQVHRDIANQTQALHDAQTWLESIGR